MSASLKTILAGISDIVAIEGNFKVDTICSDFADSIEYAKKAKEDFENFNTNHEQDLVDAGTAIDNILAGIDAMKSIGNVEKLEQYEPESIDTSEWLTAIRSYQLNVDNMK